MPCGLQIVAIDTKICTFGDKVSVGDVMVEIDGREVKTLADATTKTSSVVGEKEEEELQQDRSIIICKREYYLMDEEWEKILSPTAATIESTSNIITGVTTRQQQRNDVVIDTTLMQTTCHDAFQQNLLTELKEETNKRCNRLGGLVVGVTTDAVAPCISSIVTTESHSLTVPNNETLALVSTPSNTPTTTNISSNPTTTTTVPVEQSSLSTNDDDTIVHSGWLRKKTKHGKWVRRYFVLNSTGTIHYSHSKSQGMKMIRLITGCARIERGMSIPTEFRIYGGSSSSSSTQLVATLRARDANDTICWVETIQRISEQRRQQQQQQQQHKCLAHVDNNQENNMVATMQDQSTNVIVNPTELTSKVPMPIVVEALPPNVPITTTNDDDEPSIEADVIVDVENNDESAPMESLVTILNELIASPTAHSIKIDSIKEEENENDTKSNDEPNPRAALMLMLNKRSNLLSSTSSETESKAVENESEQDHPEDEIDADPKLKDDPVYAKYYKMLKLGLAKEVAQHAMIRDKLDPRCVFLFYAVYVNNFIYIVSFFLTWLFSILDLDPDRPLKVQRAIGSDEKQANTNKHAAAPIIKDDPRFSKYYKMLKMVSHTFCLLTFICIYSPQRKLLTQREILDILLATRDCQWLR